MSSLELNIELWMVSNELTIFGNLFKCGKINDLANHICNCFKCICFYMFLAPFFSMNSTVTAVS